MRNTLTILAALLVFVGGFAGAGFLAPGINADRKEDNLSVSDEVYDLPADMAVWQAALGTFRGLAVNLMWQRAENLKNDGKYYEAIQLGKAITRLQPRFPKVWEFVSWNLAYNISVGTTTDEERWTWVKAGIDLLQRKGNGIDANPNDLPLYAQLGWIYFHKVGEFQDNRSWTYKRKIAEMWQEALGTPPQGKADYLNWLSEMRDAPVGVDGLAEGPRTLARWLLDNGGAFDRATLAAYTVPIGYKERAATAEELSQAAAGATSRPSAGAVLEVVTTKQWPEFATDADKAAVVTFLRKKVVEGDEFNMSLRKMVEFGEKFGVIDYRQPAAHTLYWSQLGLERVAADSGRDPTALTATRRNVLNGLQTLAQAGQVMYDPTSDYITYLPEWPMWISYDEYYNDIAKAEGEDAKKVDGAFGAGYRSQMDQAIISADMLGAPQVAEQVYERMRLHFSGTQFAERYTAPLDVFVREQMKDSLDQPKVLRNIVSSLLSQSITQGVLGQRGPAQATMATAKRLFDEYRQLNPNPMDPLYQEMPPLEQLVLSAKADFIVGRVGPMGSRPLPIRARAGVYASLSDVERAIVLLQSGNQQAIARDAAADGYDPAELFPRPSPQALQFAARELKAQSDAQKRDAEAGQPRREVN